MKKILCALVVVFLVLLTPSPVLAMKDGVNIMVFYWNAYWSPPNFLNTEEYLKPKQLRYLLPFYAKILDDSSIQLREDNQDTVDKEIRFAGASGIDTMVLFWWDYLGINPRAGDPNQTDFNYFIRFYLSSSYKDTVKFAIVAPPDKITFSNDIESKWNSSFTPHLIDFMKRPQYQKVLDGRPLVFFMRSSTAVAKFGSEENYKNAIQRFRNAVQNDPTIHKNPYIVDLHSFDASLSKRLGFDAQTAYISHYLSGRTYQNGTLWPFTDLMKSNQDVWESNARQPISTIPTLHVGWNNLPFPPPGSPTPEPNSNAVIFAQATPTEIVTNITNAITWTKNHITNVPIQAVLIFEWGDFGEGGWLVPTIYEGDARLQAISKFLKGNYFTSPRFKGRDINGDKKIDINDINQIVADFGKTMDPIPLNADINANGKVDIFDYNELVTNLGK